MRMEGFLRHIFISDLVKELLGPRNGSLEQLPATDDPRNEYGMGQLVPPGVNVDRLPEEDASLGTNISGGEDDSEDETPATFVNQAMIDSGQNFRRIPSSLGISFVLNEFPRKGEIKICATWGRYIFSEVTGWTRQPTFWIDEFEGGSDEEKTSPDSSVRLTYKISLLSDKKAKVSIYLTSAIVPESEHRLKSDQIIFQPEIRVRLANPSRLSELGELGFLTNDKEWRLSTRQYDKLKTYARGHLCGAYWREIDPQKSDSTTTNQSSSQIPFVWSDGLHFAQTDAEIQEFFDPDLRTDFIPMYSAPAPRIDPSNKSASSSLELSAEKIAACKSIEDLKVCLKPLIDNYKTWISTQKSEPSSESPDEEIIIRHHDALKRIEKGIEFLSSDKEAFASFLFMNKAMSIQYAWGRKSPNNEMFWRPFQLAFILLSLSSTAKKNEEREICDTIWFPTGGGKTEAYLGLAAFALAYRRRISKDSGSEDKAGEGTCVISRYTLRLLTIQQFRRALKMIMACETLRCTSVTSEKMGWTPYVLSSENGMIWGRTPFSIGLWVGSAVTPNAMSGEGWKNIAPGAIPLLKRPASNDASDPAQVIECPCCSTYLSLPVDGVKKGNFTLHLMVDSEASAQNIDLAQLSSPKLDVLSLDFKKHFSGNCTYLKIELNLKHQITPSDLSRWWTEKAEPVLAFRLCSFNAARPGYFPVESGRRGGINDYEIRCPNSECELNQLIYRAKRPVSSSSWDWATPHPIFSINSHEVPSTKGIPIHAVTVDEKLYANPTSMLISTCDKLAMAAFMNDAAALFGRVRSYGSDGYGQEVATTRTRFNVNHFSPPSLIIQDELHLLEGPLGSSFGLYETAVDYLCDHPKYIASSATIRNSIEQISALMGRKSMIFPPVSLDIGDGFFLKSQESHPLDESSPGRLFLGVGFPGRAPQTPMLRIWGRLLQTAENLKNQGADQSQLDYFWTLIGYFNAVRELAQGETLLRQDVPQYLDKVQRQNPGNPKRELPPEGFRNLSSQTGSSELPGILATMERKMDKGDALNAVATTSMFGTGVDVTRLSLMIVHGQPKSASQYIQAVGRIGRSRAGLAVVFFRVSKPRDLNHYEYFTGYHRKLPVAVEPITVKPLAPKALEKTIGGLLAIIVRNWRNERIQLPQGIDIEEGAALIRQIEAPALRAIIECFERKWLDQPEERRPPNKERFLDYVRSQIERWQEFARRQQEAGQALHYKGGSPVTLGSSQGASVFQNVPKSLREVEPTINIYTRSE